MTNKKALDILERHNLWRRGADAVEPTDPILLGMAIDKAVEVLRLSETDVKHSANFHAKQIIKKLTLRPRLEDDDGFYDMIADEQQMIEIVQKYLERHYA